MERSIGFVFILASTALLCSQASGQVTEGSREGLTVANSIYGPTGLIKIPSAYVVAPKTFAISASFGRNIRVPAVNYGVVPYVEIGGAFVDRESADNKAIANAKVTILPSNFRWFEIGVGVIDAVDAVNQTAYFVASADLVPPNWDLPERGLETVGFKVHLGAGTGLFQEKIFGGMEALFNRRVSLIGEWDTEDVNAAVRFAPQDHVRIQIGVQGKDIHFSVTTNFRT